MSNKEKLKTGKLGKKARSRVRTKMLALFAQGRQNFRELLKRCSPSDGQAEGNINLYLKGKNKKFSPGRGLFEIGEKGTRKSDRSLEKKKKSPLEWGTVATQGVD